MSGRTRYAPRYEESWAVVVGVNDCPGVGPLAYAVNDATRVAEVLRAMGFSPEHITLLIDEQATRARILSRLQELSDKVGADDRVVFFFAGHGHTRTGHRGEVGFLVPHDGSATDLQSLVRWDDLTRIAELIPAKHTLFIVDACYGGLAVTRSSAGNKRFLKDVVSRFARQVLAAGKGDQAVADAGGPRAGHSVFTGHFLDALEGEAANEDGIITANGVMAYVYDRVSRDTNSAQTPHYGCLDGDGDFVFVAPPLNQLDDVEGHPRDVLIAGPSDARGAGVPATESDLASSVKELLAEPSKRIVLNDLVTNEVRTLLRSTAAGQFPTSGGSLSGTEFAELVQRYEDASKRLSHCTALLGKWCMDGNRSVLRSSVSRLADNIEAQGGNTVLLGMRWYPSLLAIYTSGMGAVAGHEYENLRAILTAHVGDRRTGEGSKPILIAAVDGLLDVHMAEAFKRLPGHERHFVPLSEHLFTILQPVIEDTLFLGKAYEDVFDELEVLLALVYLDLDPSPSDRPWGPPGRFAYKYRRSGRGPFSEIVTAADREGEQWPPLKAGLFGGSADRFKLLAGQYAELMGKLNWH